MVDIPVRFLLTGSDENCSGFPTPVSMCVRGKHNPFIHKYKLRVKPMYVNMYSLLFIRLLVKVSDERQEGKTDSDVSAELYIGHKEAAVCLLLVNQTRGDILTRLARIE